MMVSLAPVQAQMGTPCRGIVEGKKAGAPAREGNSMEASVPVLRRSYPACWAKADGREKNKVTTQTTANLIAKGRFIGILLVFLGSVSAQLEAREMRLSSPQLLILSVFLP
jgi:hypothetical protein